MKRVWARGAQSQQSSQCSITFLVMVFGCCWVGGGGKKASSLTPIFLQVEPAREKAFTGPTSHSQSWFACRWAVLGIFLQFAQLTEGLSPPGIIVVLNNWTCFCLSARSPSQLTRLGDPSLEGSPTRTALPLFEEAIDGHTHDMSCKIKADKPTEHMGTYGNDGTDSGGTLRIPRGSLG